LPAARAAVRKNESSRFAFFTYRKGGKPRAPELGSFVVVLDLESVVKKGRQREKRGKKNGIEKRTHRRLIAAFHIRSISLFAA
jgi:hypothetical protein